jgi:predicted metal-dependent enzyme (double-stranded beta helix superfamily)
MGDVTAGKIHRVRNVADVTAISIHTYGADVTRVGSNVRRYCDDEPEDNSRT